MFTRILSSALVVSVSLSLFAAQNGVVNTVRIDASPQHARVFDPDHALGTSIDALPYGDVDKVYTPEVLKESLSAGWGPISYRNNSELRISAWHWNANGTWSDAAHQQGYFTGSAQPGESLRHSWMYSLPHRGTTRNDGTERGYSRLTDGDPATYWKSNPYLTQRFTGEDDSLHPQWVVVDLGKLELVSSIRISWASPYATEYAVQFWSAATDPMRNPLAGTWRTFPGGTIRNSPDGTQTLALDSKPLTVRYIRIWMTHSSNTCDTNGANDPRNCVGYAISELGVGNLDDQGNFVDLVKHTPDENQTATLVSSVDPWHSAQDLEAHGGDHAGFDLFYTSGITNNLPAMIPVAMLYGTPDDAAAEIAYLEARHYPIAYVEMGEEPDGQFALPEDYAALYIQWAAALHKVDPALKLGGPVFEGVNEDVRVWPDAQGESSWLVRFLNYLKAHGRLSDLAFLSFEHYPFEGCDTTWADLYREPELMSHILQVWREDGLPSNVPMFITESNLAPAENVMMADLFGGLWLADSTAVFLTDGGGLLTHSPIQPEALRPGCRGWSTYGNFVADKELRVRAHTAQYYASRFINLEWVKHGAGEHKIYPADSDVEDLAGHKLVTAYAVERPDGQWSILMVNKDQSNAHRVQVRFGNAGQQQCLVGLSRMVTFGAEQYAWRSDGAASYPDPNSPPVVQSVDLSQTALLPKASITVVTGHVTACAHRP